MMRSLILIFGFFSIIGISTIFSGPLPSKDGKVKTNQANLFNSSVQATEA